MNYYNYVDFDFSSPFIRGDYNYYLSNSRLDYNPLQFKYEFFEYSFNGFYLVSALPDKNITRLDYLDGLKIIITKK